MAKGDISVALRMVGAKRFQAEAAASAKALGGIEGKAKGLQAAGTKLRTFGASMSKFVTLPVLGAGAASVKFAADFEQQMSTLGAVTNQGAAGMERFRKQAMKAGADTMFSASEAAQAQIELAKGGVSAADILSGGLNASLALAAAGELDLAQAGQITANSLNLFGLKGKEAIRVADMLATAANTTTADVADFGMALTQGGGAAKQAGWSMADTVLQLEALAKIGTKNSDAGTAMKTALMQLAAPTAKQSELAKELGLNFVDQHGRIKDVVQISEMLRQKLGGMTKAQRLADLKTLAGTDGFRTLASAYDAGPKKLARWAKGLQKEGTAADVAAKKQNNLKGKLEALKGSLETAAIAIGTILIPPLTNLAKWLAKLVNKFTELPTSVKTTIVTFLLVAAAMGPIVWIAGLIVSGVGKMILLFVFLKKVLIAARVAWALLSAGLLLSPLGWIILGVVAVVAALVLLWKKCEWFRNAVKAVLSAVAAAFSWAFNAIKTVVVAGAKFLVAFARAGLRVYKAIWVTVMRAVLAVVRTVWNAIKAVFRAGLAVVKTVARLIGKGVLAGFRVITGVVGIVRGAFSAVFGFLKGAVSTILGIGRSIGSGLVDGLKAGARGVAAFFKSVFNGVISIINGAIDAINAATPGKISIPLAPDIPGIPDIPHVPQLAAGGVFSGAAIVGERGPELAVHGSRGTTITPLATGGLGGSLGITVNSELVVDGEVLARSVSRHKRLLSDAVFGHESDRTARE